jgi:transcriptional regulator with XRE-family HTH domain
MAEQPGERLRRLREAKGWTQEELERRSGVRQATISQLESGQQTDAMGATWRALADTLDEMVDYLMCRIDRRDDPHGSPGETLWVDRSHLPQGVCPALARLTTRIVAWRRRLTQVVEGCQFFACVPPQLLAH